MPKKKDNQIDKSGHTHGQESAEKSRYFLSKHKIDKREKKDHDAVAGKEKSNVSKKGVIAGQIIKMEVDLKVVMSDCVEVLCHKTMILQDTSKLKRQKAKLQLKIKNLSYRRRVRSTLTSAIRWKQYHDFYATSLDKRWHI